MPKITFKKVYDEAKTIIEKNDPKAKISKLSSVGIELINEIIGKPIDGKVRSISVAQTDIVTSANSVKKTYVKFVTQVCENEKAFVSLKNKGWIFSESDISTSRGDYAEIGRTGAYIYTNCNIDLLIVKFVKTILDVEGETGLDNYIFTIEFSGNNSIYMEPMNTWWPSQEEYSLNLTKEDWKKYILEVELQNHPSPMKMLKGMMLLGGEASCKQLSEIYGGHPSAYAGCAMNLGRRVKKYFNLSPCMDGEQERYFPFPFIGKYRGGSEDNYLYRIRTELYDALNEIDLSIIDPNYERGEEQLSTKEILQHINIYIAAKGFTFDEGLVENYYLSLKSKPFVILAGTSGTGKTRLVRLFAETIGATSKNGRYKLVSVRPDWSDSSDLFGHVDLNGKFVPGAIIDFINAAEWDSENPYFLCLDEMNLARVEYYLSDILSIIETRDLKDNSITTDPLISENYYGTDEDALEKYGEIRIPENLYIVGTVNMDETTFPFSRKVLDRANTIEFSTVDFLKEIEIQTLDMPRPMYLGNDFIKADYVFFKQCESEKEYVDKLCVELQEINKILQKANAHVGYRVRDEIAFYMLNNKNADLLSRDEAFDNEIMQKILPRIQGSSVAVKNMLCELFKHCAGEYESYQTESDDISSKMFKAAQKTECKYKKSAEKIAYMVRRFEEDGFTAYWL